MRIGPDIFDYSGVPIGGGARCDRVASADQFVYRIIDVEAAEAEPLLALLRWCVPLAK